MKSHWLLAVGLGAIVATGVSPWAATSVMALEPAAQLAESQVPKGKRTKPGLYVTSKQASAALGEAENAVLLDVRTVAEVALVGAPARAYNVPFLRFVSVSEHPNLKRSHAMVPNQQFAAAVDELMTRLGKDKSTEVFVMCRSGGRSAAAVDALAALGYKNAYSVIDGFEGDTDRATGRRTINGWKNSGLAWTYKLPAEQSYRPPVTGAVTGLTD